MPRNQGALSRLAELMRRVNSSTDTEVILEEIAHGVVDVLGYGVAAIARLEGDTLVMTNVAGPPEVVAQILHRRTPAEQILDEFRAGRQVGHPALRPAGRMSEERLRAAWIPEVAARATTPTPGTPSTRSTPRSTPPSGELLGNMAVDLPPDARVPNEADRELLEMFVVQAGVALSNARERERLTDRLRLDRMLTAVARRRHPARPHRGARPRRSPRSPRRFGTVQTVVRTFPADAQGSQVGIAHARWPFTPADDVPEIRDRPQRARRPARC